MFPTIESRVEKARDKNRFARFSHRDEAAAPGYYAVRLAVLEQLKAMRKQGSVLVLRFITPAYDVPLGVWVVREAMRKSMAAPSLRFADRDLLLAYARAVALRKFNIDLTDILKRSKLLDSLTNQQTLRRFF